LGKIDGGFLGELHQLAPIQFAEGKFVAEEFQNNCMGNSICVHEPAQTEKLRNGAGQKRAFTRLISVSCPLVCPQAPE